MLYMLTQLHFRKSPVLRPSAEGDYFVSYDEEKKRKNEKNCNKKRSDSAPKRNVYQKSSVQAVPLLCVDPFPILDKLLHGQPVHVCHQFPCFRLRSQGGHAEGL